MKILGDLIFLIVISAVLLPGVAAQPNLRIGNLAAS